MKTSSVIVVVVSLLLIGVLYQGFDQRMDQLEERLAQTEEALRPLEPLRRMMANAGSRPEIENGYQPLQATGAANVPEEGWDDPRAWCPARRDAGEEWLLLTFQNPVEAEAVRVVATYNPGAVARLVAVAASGTETTLWSGEASGEGAACVTNYAVEAPAAISRLKVFLDTAAVAGWNQIDAVALLDPEGGEHWAVEAEASSAWSWGPAREG